MGQKKNLNQILLNREIRASFFVILLAFAFLFLVSPVSVHAQTLYHGNTDKRVKESQLKNTPPEDYEVDMSMQADARDGAYDEYFLKDRLQTVKIKIDENNLNYLMQNAKDKPTVMTESVTIGDKTVGYTGLKTKGSYTLDHSVTENPGSDRFSLTVNFGKYIRKENYGVKQNFFGCRKISFNNYFFDKTMMKEFVSWTILSEMGLPAPQYGFARLYINDQYYGVYFMVEALDQSILEQYWDVKKKEVSDYLLKPEHTSLVYDEKMDKFLTSDGTFDLSSVLKIGKDGLYKASGRLKEQEALWEIDEDTLQDVAEMLPTVLLWEKRLNLLSNGKDFDGNAIDVNSDRYLELLSEIMDVDEVVKYFATHSFLVQTDNMFTGEKNYGLYVDEQGKCMILPWDYDLSFGCFYPSTAETTANLDLDVMYRREIFGFDKMTVIDEEEAYKGVPIFYVIYQNKSLMDKYHKYMRECSKIAALGGTTFTGKSYEPGWIHKLITSASESVIEGASEKLCDRAYYMNRINQPSGVKLGLPNLSKIVAMRSVGVVALADHLDTTVCGYGCNLDTLGNGAVGESSAGGILTAVDDATGIYVTANYGMKGRTDRGPSLKVRALGEKESIFEDARSSIGCIASDMEVYDITNTSDADDGNYRLSVPVSIDFAKRGAEIYQYTAEGNLKKLAATVDDNVYTVDLGTFRYIVVAKKGSVAMRIWFRPVFYAVLGMVLLIAVVILLIRKFYRSPKLK